MNDTHVRVSELVIGKLYNVEFGHSTYKSIYINSIPCSVWGMRYIFVGYDEKVIPFLPLLLIPFEMQKVFEIEGDEVKE